MELLIYPSVFVAASALVVFIFSISSGGFWRRMDKALQPFTWGTRVQLSFQRADIKLRYSEYVVICFVMIAGFVILTFLLSNSLLLSVVLGCVGGFLPKMYITRRKIARIKKFAKYFPDTVTFMANSLKAGFSTSMSMEMIAEDSQYPIKSEFNKMMREINHGEAFSDTLDGLYQRVPLEEVNIFVSAIQLHQRLGGTLSAILNKIAVIISEREELQGEINSLTAQGKLQGLVLVILPLFVIAGIYVISPEFILPLFTEPLGRTLLTIACGLEIVGAVLINKIVSIRI